MFWGGLWMAGRRYPGEYDWRYMTISSLVYADRNPHGYRWAWAGLMLCALGGLIWTRVLAWDLRWERGRPVGVSALCLGYLCMACCVLLPGLFPRIPRGHDILAVSAFLGLCIGVVQLTFLALTSFLSRMPIFRGTPRIPAVLLAAVPLCPILVAALTQAYVSRALPELPWVGLEWRARGAPAYLSFAFWEWIACLVTSAYTVILSLATGKPARSMAYGQVS